MLVKRAMFWCRICTESPRPYKLSVQKSILHFFSGNIILLQVNSSCQFQLCENERVSYISPGFSAQFRQHFGESQSLK